MRLHLLTLAWIASTAACYTGTRAARDVNLAWRGHARLDLEARLGVPREAAPQPDGTTVVRWSRGGHRDIELPGGSFALTVTPTSFAAHAELHAGSVETFEYDIAAAILDPNGTVLSFDSSWLAAGIPDGMNARTGIIFGLHGGAGRLDDASTVMPSLGAYIGGMLTADMALLGAYAFVTGKSGDDFVQGHSWGLALQYWPTPRFNVRAGPAMVIDTDPEPGNAALVPGGIGAASFAVVRAGSFVLDVRFDATVSTSSAFGTFGIGVNVN